jgi:hypothetical protein
LIDPEVLKRRQERFGIVQQQPAKAAAASIAEQNPSSPVGKKQKLDNATAVPVKLILSKEEEELRQKRLERFGGASAALSSTKPTSDSSNAAPETTK